MILDLTFGKINGKIYFEKDQVIKILLSLLPYVGSSVKEYLTKGIENIQKIK